MQAHAADLSTQEQRVLGLIAAGKTNAQIAGELTISVCTVNNHVASILRKLGVPNRTLAAARYFEIVNQSGKK